jgi:hypothetical protein
VNVLKITKAAAMLTVTALVSVAANAQFVKGNEAVRVMTDGSKQVQTPPLPATGSFKDSKPCAASGGCNGGPWFMVETSQGLKECTEAYARQSSCRDSSYGTTKISRLWVVSSGGNWLQCQYPDLGSKCVNMFARPPANLPFDAVQ